MLKRVEIAGLLVVLALVACKSEQKKVEQQREQRKAAAGKVEGLDALPADVRVVVGANVPRLRDSALVKRAFDQMLAGDPALATRLGELMTRCKLDPGRDLESVVVGLMGSTTARDVVLVAKGTFDEAAIAACVQASLEEKGGALERKSQGGSVVYVVQNPQVSGQVAFSFGAPDTLIVADSEALLLRARDPAAPKLKGNAEMMRLVESTDTRASLWAAGQMAPEIGQGIVSASGGEVKAPATAIWGHLELGKGLSAELALEMATAEDAKGLLGVVQKQLSQYAVVAQAYALGPMVQKIRPSARDKVFVVSLSLDEKDVERLTDLLSPKLNEKEGASP